MVVEQEEWTQSSTKKPPRGAAGKRWKDGQPGTVGLTFKTSTSASTCGKVKGLDVTLNDPAGFADGSWWMIGCECVIHEWSKLRLWPLELWRADGENDTESREHFQTRIRSAIRSELLKRYDQRYDQDDPGGGNGYITSSTYAKIRDPSKAWCSGGWYRKINSRAISDSIR